jgi:hypothetical protein
MMRGWTPWIVLYVALMTALVGGTWQVRERVLATLDTPEAIEQWQQWKTETEKAAAGQGPIKRKAVRANEPALLIMLRDRFVVVVVGLAVLTSLLYFFGVIVIRGIFGARGGLPSGEAS